MKNLLLVLLLLGLLPVLRADNVLFVGNSFTYTNHMPVMFKDLATSKGKTVADDMLTKGGQGWAYHLFKISDKRDALLKSKPWNFVAIQDYSTNATHANLRNDFFKNGELFYDKIAADSPTAVIVLYETWSFPAAIEGYVKPTDAKPDDDKADKEPKAKAFKSEEEMFGEIHANYEKLYEELKVKDPKRKVLYAPVGTAFAASRKAHPEIALTGKDGKHPSVAGSYLISCVFYAVIYNESPVGAAPPTGKITMDDSYAKPLQEIAASVVLKK